MFGVYTGFVVYRPAQPPTRCPHVVFSCAFLVPWVVPQWAIPVGAAVRGAIARGQAPIGARLGKMLDACIGVCFGLWLIKTPSIVNGM